MAVPPFIQMILGAPRVSTHFDDNFSNGRKTLTAAFQNESVDNRWLRKIGVVRQPVVIGASYEIYESGTNKQIVPLTRILLRSAYRTHDTQITLTSPIPITFAIIVCEPGKMTAVDLRNNSGTIIAEGKYYIQLKILAGEEAILVERGLIIGPTPEKTYWE